MNELALDCRKETSLPDGYREPLATLRSERAVKRIANQLKHEVSKRNFNALFVRGGFLALRDTTHEISVYEEVDSHMGDKIDIVVYRHTDPVDESSRDLIRVTRIDRFVGTHYAALREDRSSLLLEAAQIYPPVPGQTS